MGATDKRLPAARSEGLLLERIDAEIVIYDLSSKEAHCLSPVATAVFAGCDGRTSPRELASRAAEDLGYPVTVEQVEQALAELDERDLLLSPSPEFSRRVLVRKTASVTAAAVAAPAITTMVVPSAAQAAASCPGTTCQQTQDCPTGCTCRNLGGGVKRCLA